MKKFVLIAAVAAFSVSLNAQDSTAMNNSYSGNVKEKTYTGNPTLDKPVVWSVGVEPSIPVGHFHDYAGFGFGGSLQAEFKTSKNVGLTINGGYIAYSGKTVDSISYSNFKYWPLMGGIKLYMGKAYVHGQAGAGFGTEGLGTSFWYGAGIGVNFTKRIDAEFRYAGWKQNKVNTGEGSGGGGIYGGGTGGTGGGGGPLYGGHYSTLGLRLAINF